MKRIYYAECDHCGWTWESTRRYKSCQNCGLTDISVWETQEQLESRRLSDVK